MQLSVQEIRLWTAFMKWEYEQQRKTLNDNANNRRSRKR